MNTTQQAIYTVPDGWRLVPVEATPEIRAAMRANGIMFPSVWRELLEAAPQPVAQGEPAAEWADPRVQIVYEILANSEDEPPPGQHWEGWAARRIVDALAAAPAGVAPVKMSAVAKRKAADLGREGYIIAGYTMTKPGARTAVLIDAAVRWLTPEQQHVLMHVEGSVIGAPAGVVGEPYCWAVTGIGRPFYGEYAEQDSRDEARRVGGTAKAFPLYTDPTARQALTDERIAAMRQAGYLDADDYPDAWAYERGVRDAERAHGIGGKGGANG